MRGKKSFTEKGKTEWRSGEREVAGERGRETDGGCRAMANSD
ncbi:hypothetical protein A2U01_0086784, partial [Trifolium medium]|nr:hypothetical protein [Trifolium medium]